MDLIKSRLIARVAIILREAGWTHRQFCAETGYSYGSLRRAMSPSSAIRSTTICELAYALGIDPGDLVGKDWEK